MVRGKELSARELTAAALARIDALDGEIGAFVAVDPDTAMVEALAVDERIAAGDQVGPLAGIPVGVKDLEDAFGFRTTKGSLLHAEDRPAAADSALVERLRSSGCVVVGKTNTPEFGWRPDTVNRAFPPTRNPWDLSRSPGGSSGGSAAAVAAGMVPLATGSDGGGSMRTPSALCGLTGLKPSLGRVPSGGASPPDWPSLSTRGVIARTARDLACCYDAVVGPDPTDLRSLPMPDASWVRAVEDVHPPRRVVWSPTLGYARVDREVRAVCERAVGLLADAGTEVLEVDGVFPEDPGTSWTIVAAVATLRTVEDVRGTERWSLLDPVLSSVLDWAAEDVSATELARAEDAGHSLNMTLVQLFHRAPFLLTPTVAGQAPPSGEDGIVDGRPERYWVKLTYPFNMTRSPAGTVCAGFTADGMPVGLQVVGPQHGDVAVLRLLAVLEDVLAIDAVPVP